MEELDTASSTRSSRKLRPDKVDDLLAAARRQFEARTAVDEAGRLRETLAGLDREQARLSEALALGAGDVPMVVDRLRQAETNRREVSATLDRVSQRRRRPASWTEVERRIRQRFQDWQCLRTRESPNSARIDGSRRTRAKVYRIAVMRRRVGQT
jgi:hypothetical protein